MKETEDRFLQLLRDALWHTGLSRQAMEVSDYQAVMQLAKQQAVPALVADALVRNDFQTNDDCSMATMAAIVRHQRKYKKMNEDLLVLTRVLHEAQIPYVVFKGQVVAALYPHPALRSTGDIDFYVPRSHFMRAVNVIHKRLNVVIDADKLDKHFSFSYRGTRFEMHHRIETFGYKGHQHRFDRLIDKEMAEHAAYREVAGEKVAVLCPLADLVVVFKHLFNHLLVEGVGMRQVCDLAILLHAYRGQYDAVELESYLYQMGYLRAFKAMGTLLVRHLSLPAEDFPFPLEKRWNRWADLLMQEVMACGNFGRAGRKEQHDGKAKSIETARIAMRHCLTYLPLAPFDIACLIPRRIGITLRKYMIRG